MTAYVLQEGKQAYVTATGAPANGWKLYTYDTGTLNPRTTWLDSGQVTPNTNPIILDARGECVVFWSGVYRVRLEDNLGNTIWGPIDGLSVLDPTAALITDLATSNNGSKGAGMIGFGPAVSYLPNTVGSFLNQAYGRTTAETTAGVTPTNYYVPPDNMLGEINAFRYGFASSASAATNTTAIANALLVAKAQTGAGGTVRLASGNFNCNAFDIPEFCYVRGAGGRATNFTFASSGTNIRIGGTTLTGVLKYKCGISDVSILLTHKDGHAISILECAGAEVSRCYIEGTLTAARSNRAIVIDGGNISSFFNRISDVIANHVETGYTLLTSGTTETTRNYFSNCTVLGDVGSFPNSIGLRITNLCGSGNEWNGGNFESCGKGVIGENNCKSFSVVGACFEGNTIDAEGQPTANEFAIVACLIDNPGHVTNTTYRVKLIGCFNGSGQPSDSTDPGSHLLPAFLAGQTPLIIEGFPGDTTTEELIIRNSGGSKTLSVTNQGKFLRINNAAPVAVNAASVDLATVIALCNQLRAQLIAVGICA